MDGCKGSGDVVGTEGMICGGGVVAVLLSSLLSILTEGKEEEIFCAANADCSDDSIIPVTFTL
jgi:hypothetical protein